MTTEGAFPILSPHPTPANGAAAVFELSSFIAPTAKKKKTEKSAVFAGVGVSVCRSVRLSILRTFLSLRREKP
jgi:hypothetical protein